jgi:hypothetical protein
MQRKPLFLAASIAESARFFALFFLADAVGGLHGGGGQASFFRYAASAQLLFGVGFFFLWFDGSRYDPYRPLLFLGKLLSLATFVPLLVSLLGDFQAFTLRGRAGPLAAGIALALDIFGFCVLLGTGPFSRATFEAPPPDSPSAPTYPRGPEDIEDVEG